MWGKLHRRWPARPSTSRCKVLLLSHTCKIRHSVSSVTRRSWLTFLFQLWPPVSPYPGIEGVEEILSDVEGVPRHCNHCAHTCFWMQHKITLIIKRTVKGGKIVPNLACDQWEVYVWFMLACWGHLLSVSYYLEVWKTLHRCQQSSLLELSYHLQPWNTGFRSVLPVVQRCPTLWRWSSRHGTPGCNLDTKENNLNLFSTLLGV